MQQLYLARDTTARDTADTAGIGEGKDAVSIRKVLNL